MVSLMYGLDTIMFAVLFIAIIILLVANRQMDVNLGSSPDDFLLWKKIKMVSFLILIFSGAAVVLISFCLWMLRLT